MYKSREGRCNEEPTLLKILNNISPNIYFFSSDLDKILYLRCSKKQCSLYVSFLGIGEVGAILHLRTSINFYP